jgi:hypothetical protein
MTSTPINVVIGRDRMERRQVSTVTRQFKRSFGEETLNELGREVRFCQRERQITPFRLALSLMESFSSGATKCIADIQRAFNAMCETTVCYKPFHNQLAKSQFPTFVRLLLSRLLGELACEVLRFSASSPFARFEHIRIQDGTSFAVKPALAGTFPGRFTTISPAAVELHADLDLMSEVMNRVVLSPDSSAERQFLPDAQEVAGGLLLADRGYFSRDYLRDIDSAGGHFIVRAGKSINPLIVHALDPQGGEVKRLLNRRLKEVMGKLKRFEYLDLVVRFQTSNGPWECRLVVHPHLKAKEVRYLATNLDPQAFTPEHVSDGYRLRWQVELRFKEWKSYAHLQAFDTANPHITEGLIWAALCAATLKRYCAHMTQCLFAVAMSTHTVAKCIHHVLSDVLHALLHQPWDVHRRIERAMSYLATNAQRAHPKRDQQTGRLKLGLEHVYAAA